MTTPTLTMQPSYGAKLPNEPRVLKAVFGEGYVARTQDGINNIPEVWDVSFDNLDDVDRDYLLDFFDALGGSDPFMWTNLRGQTKAYVCTNYDLDQTDEEDASIACKFERVPTP